MAANTGAATSTLAQALMATSAVISMFFHARPNGAPHSLRKATSSAVAGPHPFSAAPRG